MWSVYMPASQNTMKFVTIIFVPVCHPSHQGVAQEAAFDVDASRGSPKSCCIQARWRRISVPSPCRCTLPLLDNVAAAVMCFY